MQNLRRLFGMRASKFRSFLGVISLKTSKFGAGERNLRIFTTIFCNLYSLQVEHASLTILSSQRNGLKKCHQSSKQKDNFLQLKAKLSQRLVTPLVFLYEISIIFDRIKIMYFLIPFLKPVQQICFDSLRLKIILNARKMRPP